MSFGSNPFGGETFGEHAWSKEVLFDLIPEFYRAQDEQLGGFLRSLVEGERPTFDQLRRKIRAFHKIKEPLETRTQYDEVVALVLGKQLLTQGEVFQRGVDGSINAFRELVSPIARFRDEDVGKELEISESANPSNNTKVVITSVVSLNKVKTEPFLDPDVGPLRWLLREKVDTTVDHVTVEIASGDAGDITPGWVLFDGLSEFEVLIRRQFKAATKDRKLLTEREGADGSVDSIGRVVATTGMFTAKDVGKKFSLSGSLIPTNNGKVEIRHVDPTTSTRIFTSFELLRGEDSDGGVTYSARTGTENVRVAHLQQGVNTPLSIEVTDSDIIVHLATDVTGAVISTANDIETALLADFFAPLLVLVGVTGAGTGIAAAHEFVPVVGTLLRPDSGPLVWAVLPFAELVLSGNALPQGFVQQDGADLSVDTVSQVSSLTARFTSNDTGKLLSIRGSTFGNDGVFVVSQVVTANTVILDGLLTVEPGPLVWELRTKTFTAITAQSSLVQAHAPSLITLLAKDFGIEVDTQESEARQRSWVRNVTAWIGKKGNSESYRIIGAISGFDVFTKQLFRITQDIAAIPVPGPCLFEVGETTPGKFGTDGSIALAGGVVELSSPTALFDPKDIDRQIRLTNAGLVGNNKLYTIESITSPTAVRFRVVDTATLPETNNGVLHWAVVRLYSDLAPTLPLYDEFNEDLMEQLIDGLPPQTTNKFSIDKYCWEPDFSSAIPVIVNGATLLFNNVYQLNVSGPPVISAVGNWKIVYDLPVVESYFLETVPVVNPTTRIQRGYLAFGAAADVATVTLASPVSSLGKAFAKTTSVVKASGGRSGGSTGDKNNNDVGVTALLTAVDTITFTREATGEDFDYAVDWEVWEYVGPDGGPDEWKVVLQQEVSLPAATTTVDTAIVVSNPAKAVPIVCGLRNTLGTATWSNVSCSAQIIAGPNVRVLRGGASGDTTASVAVIEFTGSRWVVQEVVHTFVAAGVNEAEALSTDVLSWQTAFLVSSMKVPSGEDDNDAVGWNAWPDMTNTAQVFFRLRSTQGDPTNTTVVAYVVKHPFLLAQHEDSLLGGQVELPAGAASPQSAFRGINVVYESGDVTLLATADCEGAAPKYARPFWDYRLHTITSVEFFRGRHGAASDWALSVVKFPETLTFNVIALNAPSAPDPANFIYKCPVVLSCDYCASYRVLATIEAGSISSESGQAIQQVLARVITRLKDEAKPAHVELIPRLRQNQVASIFWQASVQVP